jgi:transcriptional regulator with XRE-family HTH domain
MTTPDNSLASRLKRLRLKSGRSGRELSIAAGLSANTVTEIEANPQRSPRISAVQALADALGVSLSYLAEGITGNGARIGFSESDAAPWVPAPSGQRPDRTEAQTRIARTLAPNSQQVATFEVTTGMPGFNLDRADVLVIDMKAPAAQGDLVVATVANLETAAATTVVRRYLPPYLIPSDSSNARDILVVDGARTVILGKVAASFRAPQLSE